MVKSKGGAGRQLGKGIYLTPNFKGWPEAEANRGPDDPPLWDCVATVDPAYWDAANKAWIWQYYSFPEDQDNDPDACVALKMWGMFPGTQLIQLLLFLRADRPSGSSNQGSRPLLAELESHVDSGEHFALLLCRRLYRDGPAGVGPRRNYRRRSILLQLC